MTRLRGGLLLAGSLLVALLAVRGSQWVEALAQPASFAETDYQLHWAAGRALATGLDPYDPATVDTIGATTGRPMTPFCAATPLFVAGFAWLGELPFEDGFRLLLGINGALLLISMALLAGALCSAGLPAAAALATAVLLVALNDGTWMALWFNQLNFVTLAALAGALWCGARGHARGEGALLALAAWAKVSPVLILVFLACAGRWRTVRAALVAAVALLALSLAVAGWEAHVSWLAMARHELGYAAQRPPGLFNNSLHAWNLAPNAVLWRAAQAGEGSRGAVLAGTWLVTLATVGLVLHELRRRREVAPREAFAVHALGISAGFLVSSTTWVTHLSLAAVPLAFLVLRAWESPGPGLGVRAAGALAAILLFVPLGTFEATHELRLDILAKLAGCVLLFLAVLLATRPPRLSPRPAAG